MNYKKQAIMNTVGNVVTLFCQWLILLLLPRMGGFGEAGVFSLAISVASIFNIVAAFNMRSYQVVDGYVSETEGGFLSSRLLTVGISFMACFCYLGIADYSSVQALAIVAYLLYKNILSLADIYAGTLQINNRLDLVGLGSFIEGIISVTSFFMTYYTTRKLLFSILLMAICGGSFYFTFIVFCRWKTAGERIEAPQSMKNALSILKKCFPLFLAAIFPVILNAIPKIILQKHGGDVLVGIFSTLSAPTIVITTIATGLFAPLITRFSTLAKLKNYKRFRFKFTLGLVILFISGVICLGLSILLGQWFFGWLYNKEIIVHIHVFYCLVCAVVFCAISTYSATILVTLERLTFVAVTSFIALVVGTVASILFIPALGMIGASWGLLTAYLMQVIMQVTGIYIFTVGSIDIG